EKPGDTAFMFFKGLKFGSRWNIVTDGHRWGLIVDPCIETDDNKSFRLMAISDADKGRLIHLDSEVHLHKVLMGLNRGDLELMKKEQNEN
ncbi:MAG: hypothetical protein U9Q17_01395, partial [Chloroflexota bacterium]|nr:hypothetical protein [Chloroflexota bacterium]